MDNRVLDKEFMNRYKAYDCLRIMAESIIGSGFEFVTLDIYDKDLDGRPGLLLQDSGDANVQRPSLMPAVNFCLESPIIATRFFHHINKRAGRFKYTFSWRGAYERLAGTSTTFEHIVWPNPVDCLIEPDPWHNRKLVCMISSNKRAFGNLWTGLMEEPWSELVKTKLRYLRTFYIRRTDPWMGSELYIERIRIIEHFSRTGKFDLYGTLWEKPIPDFEHDIRPLIQTTYRGAPASDQKLETLKNYKFSLAVENCSFPGYVTEKIYDCLLAGVIPVYLGAPDICDFVPADCFVDVRSFDNYSDLYEFISNLTEGEALNYLTAGRRFLDSDVFKSNSVSSFCDKIIRALQCS